MRRLVCTCVVRKPPKTGFLASRPKCTFLPFCLLTNCEHGSSLSFLYHCPFNCCPESTSPIDTLEALLVLGLVFELNFPCPISSIIAASYPGSSPRNSNSHAVLLKFELLHVKTKTRIGRRRVCYNGYFLLSQKR